MPGLGDLRFLAAKNPWRFRNRRGFFDFGEGAFRSFVLGPNEWRRDQTLDLEHFPAFPAETRRTENARERRLLRIRKPAQHGALMILPTEEDGEDAHAAGVVIDLEIEHGALFRH